MDPAGGGLVAVLFQIRHERRAAGSDIVGIGEVAMALLLDISRRVLKVPGAEPLNAIGALVKGVAQSGMAGAAGEHVGPERGTALQGFNVRPMRRRHIFPHLLQIGPQRVGSMLYADDCIQSGDDRTLGAGLPPKLERLLRGVHPLINQTVGEGWLVLSAVEIGSDAVKINVGVAPLWHPVECGLHPPHHHCGFLQCIGQVARPILPGTLLRRHEPPYCRDVMTTSIAQRTISGFSLPHSKPTLKRDVIVVSWGSPCAVKAIRRNARQEPRRDYT